MGWHGYVSHAASVGMKSLIYECIAAAFSDAYVTTSFWSPCKASILFGDYGALGLKSSVMRRLPNPEMRMLYSSYHSCRVLDLDAGNSSSLIVQEIC